MNLPTQFLAIFEHPAPALHFEDFHEPYDRFMAAPVSHRLRSPPDIAGTELLTTLNRYDAMQSFCDFYRSHDGMELCRILNPRYDDFRPLLELKPAKDISAFTRRYQPGGDRDFVIDFNKSKTIYRSANSWIAFAEIGDGPACLATFLDGDNAGAVFYVTTQPEFNILRPIAKNFFSLLERIGKNIAAFLNLIRITVLIQDAEPRYCGCRIIAYFPNLETSPPKGMRVDRR